MIYKLSNSVGELDIKDVLRAQTIYKDKVSKPEGRW